MKSAVWMILLVVGWSACQSKKERYLASIESMPSFEVLKLDSTTIVEANDIPEGRPSLIVYFRPDCPHCKAETENLLRDAGKFADFNFVFLTGSALSNAKAFATTYHFEKYRNIVIGKDYNHSFAQRFEPEAVPFTALYSQKKTLIALYKGEITSEQILSAIHE